MNLKNCFNTSVAAIAIIGAMVLSSCSHDEFYYSEEKVEQTVNEKYAVAFEKAFGKVGPNVDWGFSSKNANAPAFTRAEEGEKTNYAKYRGHIEPTNMVFPTDWPASEFKDAVPAGVGKLPTEGGGAATPWFIDAGTQSVSTWNTGGTLYVVGNVDLSNSNFDINPEWQIYLVEGSTLKLSVNSAENLKGFYYIGKNATLETSGRLKLNSGAKVYIHKEGTIKVKDLEVNSTSFLYNRGTLTATGTVSAESNESRIVNDNIINCATVVVNAGGVQNNYEWTVTGTTEINSNNSGWVNNGHWTTNDYVYIAGSWNVINNCYLEVENDFEMNISSEKGAFKIDGGGGVLTKNFIGGGYSKEGAISGPFVIVMGPKAVFVVEETAKLESGRYDEEGFGIFGPSSDSEGEYAVFQAKNIVRDPYLERINSHGAVTYGGKLYVSAKTHFAQGMDSDGTGSYVPQPYIYEYDGFSIENNIYASGFNDGKPNISIPETPCSPGFLGSDPLYRVIAEDLSASEDGDFDFNDVVFDVVKAENGKTTLRLICAGGVLPLKVGGVEVHGLFGDTTPMLDQHPMYNTGAGPTVNPVEFDVEGTYLEGTDSDPSLIKNIKIEVYKENQWMELEANTGKAACKILVDNTFSVVEERHSIADENTNFHKYVQGTWDSDVNGFWWQKKN